MFNFQQNVKMKTVLIAGGTGYIGRKLALRLQEEGYEVLILSRNPIASNHVFWNPERKEIAIDACKETSVLINLCGAGIHEKRWTKKRKLELQQSRVEVTKMLFELTQTLPLEHYIGASGITAYGTDDGSIQHKEDDAYGIDFLSQLVNDWEQASDLFQSRCKVAKIRIAVTLDIETGVVQEMARLTKVGLGAVLGSGRQQIPWVAIEDLVDLFVFAVRHKLEGVYNSNTDNCSNKELTHAIANYYNRKIWLPNIPPIVLKLVLGEMSSLVLDGSSASNEKIRNSDFIPKFRTLSSVFGK